MLRFAQHDNPRVTKPQFVPAWSIAHFASLTQFGYLVSNSYRRLMLGEGLAQAPAIESVTIMLRTLTETRNWRLRSGIRDARGDLAVFTCESILTVEDRRQRQHTDLVDPYERAHA